MCFGGEEEMETTKKTETKRHTYTRYKLNKKKNIKNDEGKTVILKIKFEKHCGVFFLFFVAIHCSPLNFLLFFCLAVLVAALAALVIRRLLFDEEFELAVVDVDSAGEASAPGVGTS